jgi:hypothetical protein
MEAINGFSEFIPEGALLGVEMGQLMVAVGEVEQIVPLRNPTFQEFETIRLGK